MNANAKIRRKCLECGIIYDDADMIFGIKKCPSCFSAENFKYVDRYGREVVIYEARPIICEEIQENFDDVGCNMASVFLKVPATIISCTQDCPFQPDCVEWLGPHQRTVLSRIFNHREKIKAVLNMVDKNISQSIIRDVVHISSATLYKWRNERSKYEAIANGDISAILLDAKHARTAQAHLSKSCAKNSRS